MERAVEKVRQRLLRAASALEQAGVPYAVVGGNAVAAWVSRVDEAAVRNTQDVDILIQRNDLPAAIEAMSKAGFIHRHAAGIDMLLDGPQAKARDAVHLVFAGEKVRPEYAAARARRCRERSGGPFSPPVAGIAGADEAHVIPRQGSHASSRSHRGRAD